MDIFFLVLAFLAAFHLMYEGVIAPELRMGIRNDLFEVRDSLRAIKCSSDSKSVDDESFQIVHDAVNRFTSRVSSFTIFVAVQVRQLRTRDPEVYAKMKKRSERLAAVPSAEFQKVLKRMDAIVVKAMLVNSGAWFVFIVPVILLMTLLARLSKFAMAIIALPANMFEGLVAKQDRRLTA